RREDRTSHVARRATGPRLGARGAAPEGHAERLRSSAPRAIIRQTARRPIDPGMGDRPMDYRDYQHLTFERRPHGVVLNTTNDRLHWELTQIWLTLDADDDARVAVVTGAGRAFSAGGDLDMVDAN